MYIKNDNMDVLINKNIYKISLVKNKNKKQAIEQKKYYLKKQTCSNYFFYSWQQFRNRAGHEENT